MAQLVEQRIRNAQAVGSSPTSSSTSEQSPLCSGLFFALGRKIGHPPAPLLLLTEKGHAHVACSLASTLTTALAVYQLFSVKSTTRYLFFNKTHVVADYVSLATTF